MKNKNLEKEAQAKKWAKEDIISYSIVNSILESLLIAIVIIAQVKGGENLRQTLCTIIGIAGAIYGIFIVIKEGEGSVFGAIAAGTIVGLILGGIIVWPLYNQTSRIVTLIVGTLIVLIKEILEIRKAKHSYGD